DPHHRRDGRMPRGAADGLAAPHRARVTATKAQPTRDEGHPRTTQRQAIGRAHRITTATQAARARAAPRRFDGITRIEDGLGRGPCAPDRRWRPTWDTIALPRSAQAGPEMAALAPFYRDWTWTGTIEAGGMGPGSPEMSGVGHAVCRLGPDGLWYAC